MKNPVLILIIAFFAVSCTGISFLSKKETVLYIIIENGKVGYIDENGKIIIEPQFDYCGGQYFYLSDCTDFFYTDGYAIVTKGNKYGLINRKGKTVLNFKYDVLIDEFDGNYLTTVNGKYGMINHKGKTVIPFLFDSEYFLSADDIFPAKINDICVLYNPKDGSVSETEYSHTSPFFHGYAVVEKGREEGIIDRKGNVIFDAVYDEIDNFNKEYICASKNSQWSFMNIKQERVIDSVYYDAECFEDGYAVVKRFKYGVIDSLGNIIIPFEYEHLENSGDGYFEFSGKNPYVFGLINYKQDTLLDCKYSYIFYHDGIGQIAKSQYDMYGVINVETGEELIPCVFSSVEYFDDLLTRLHFVSDDGKEFFGYINHKNKIIWSNNAELLEEKLKK